MSLASDLLESSKDNRVIVHQMNETDSEQDYTYQRTTMEKVKNTMVP